VLDAAEVERRAGWPVVSLDAVASTNDEAARRLPTSSSGRVVVVASTQTAGRGRGGARFSSPEGGLYASLAFRARVEDVPAPLVAAAGVAVAQAVERVAGLRVELKWPNDVWVEGRKAAGILVEASMGGRSGAGGARREPEPSEVDAVVGIGVNVAAVPPDLPPDVLAATTALDLHARSPVRHEDLLVEILAALDDARIALATARGLARVEAEYRGRAALLGRRVRYRVGDTEEAGVLRDLTLARGLEVETEGGEVVWRPMALVRTLRADPWTDPSRHR
jgi:BirA family biotin operon repressor/biotin-[acetyl-CoA-carboxylase] ligase